mmetsp:Transcript_26715/g.61137  ORF Transcript_26715/g.61137 Transcript_26715/m.61137 type:complete len:258 (+) Transcript_26715:710-1483(+)
MLCKDLLLHIHALTQLQRTDGVLTHHLYGKIVPCLLFLCEPHLSYAAGTQLARQHEVGDGRLRFVPPKRTGSVGMVPRGIVTHSFDQILRSHHLRCDEFFELRSEALEYHATHLCQLTLLHIDEPLQKSRVSADQLKWRGVARCVVDRALGDRSQALERIAKDSMPAQSCHEQLREPPLTARLDQTDKLAQLLVVISILMSNLIVDSTNTGVCFQRAFCHLCLAHTAHNPVLPPHSRVGEVVVARGRGSLHRSPHTG